MLSRVLLDDLDYRALAPGGYLAGGGPIGRFRVVSQQASAPVAVAGPRRGEAFGFPGPAGPGKSFMIKIMPVDQSVNRWKLRRFHSARPARRR